MAELLRSPWIPLLGIVLAWGTYMGIHKTRTSSRDEAVRTPAGPPRAGLVRSIGRPARQVRRHPRVKKREGPKVVEVPAVPPGRTAPSADGEFLEVTVGLRSDSMNIAESLDRLRAVIEGHPDHVNARGLLVLLLLSRRSSDVPWDDRDAREHIRFLQQRIPDQGLPDLLLARVEAIAGRADLARQHLIQGSAKDLGWFPDGELNRMRIEDHLEAGRSPSEIFGKLANTLLPSYREVRGLAHDLFYQRDESGGLNELPPPEDPAALEDHRAAARAFLQIGKQMEEDGMVLMHNLVGCSLVEFAARTLEAAGDPLPEGRAIQERWRSMKSEMRLASDILPELILADREVAREYFRDIPDRGERLAIRRAAMLYLARQTAE